MDPTLANLDEGFQELMAAAERQPKSSLVIKFSMEAMENPEKTKNAGRPVYDDVEMISIRVPGDPDIRVRPVRPEDKQAHAKEYLAWKSNQSQEAASGTPLAQWALMKRSQVEEAKYLGIHTVEQLSDVSDANLQRLGPGWMALRQKARDWLASAKDGAELNKLREALDEATRRIATMETMLKRQGEELQGKAGEGAVPVPAKDPEVAALKAAVEALLAQKATPVKVRRKPGPKSKAEKAAMAAENGTQE
jgi:hypothetical protein